MEFFDRDDYAKLKNLYIQKIKYLSMWIWKNDLSRDQIQQWLNNFDGQVDGDSEHEQINSLHLLKQYMYFSLNEVRQSLSALYRIHFYKDCIQRIRKESGIEELDELFELYKNELKRTRFLGIGNPSESSSLLLYFFRQENEIPKINFWNFHDVFLFSKNSEVTGLRDCKIQTPAGEKTETIKNYVFIDDITGSGTQAVDYFIKDNSINIVEKIYDYNNDANIYYFTLFNTQQAKERFKEKGLEKVIIKSIFQLDDTYKVYNPISRYFVEKSDSSLHQEEKEYAEKICKMNFHKFNINPQYKCGYNDGQLLLSFFYNTPDNSLPIFWMDNKDWNGVFRRYDKIYY